MRFQIDEVSVLLQMSKRTIARYVQKFWRKGNVCTAVIGRPYSCVAMHPHEELVIMEVLLQHPEKTLPEILQEVYEETGSDCSIKLLSKDVMMQEWNSELQQGIFQHFFFPFFFV